jgi:hypothetical protein
MSLISIWRRMKGLFVRRGRAKLVVVSLASGHAAVIELPPLWAKRKKLGRMCHRYYWCAVGAGMVIVLTLRAPGHAGGGCGSDAGPDGFGDRGRSPSGYCEGGSNESEYRVCP